MILFSAAFVSGLTACQDFLVREPKLEQSNEITLSTYDGLNSATAGLYGYLSEIGWYGQVFTLGTDMRSGNGVKDDVRNSNRFTQEYNWNYLPTNSTGIWSYAYVTIAAANNIIDNLAGKTETDVTEQDLNNQGRVPLHQGFGSFRLRHHIRTAVHLQAGIPRRACSPPYGL